MKALSGNRVVVAPDSFKGTLTAQQAAAAIAGGLREAVPGLELVVLPQADGGEGTAAALQPFLASARLEAVDGGDVLCFEEDGVSAVLIESARFIGLGLPGMRRQVIDRRGTGALGRALRHAIACGHRRILIGLGGSATNDAGLGLLCALGLVAYDVAGDRVSPDLQGLLRIHRIEAGGLEPRLRECRITVLRDVDAPLCGPGGATLTFGRQKGLVSDDLDRVEAAVARFRDLLSAALSLDCATRAGAGAAGGLGYALCMLGADLRSGAEFVAERSGLVGEMRRARYVITGEGRSDRQTLAGKLPMQVARLAAEAQVPVLLLSGSIDPAAASALAPWFSEVRAVTDGDGSAVVSRSGAAPSLREAARRWAVERLTRA